MAIHWIPGENGTITVTWREALEGVAVSIEAEEVTPDLRRTIPDTAQLCPRIGVGCHCRILRNTEKPDRIQKIDGGECVSPLIGFKIDRRGERKKREEEKISCTLIFALLLVASATVHLLSTMLL